MLSLRTNATTGNVLSNKSMHPWPPNMLAQEVNSFGHSKMMGTM